LNIKEAAPQLASMNQGIIVAVVQVWDHDDCGFLLLDNMLWEGT